MMFHSKNRMFSKSLYIVHQLSGLRKSYRPISHQKLNFALSEAAKFIDYPTGNERRILLNELMDTAGYLRTSNSMNHPLREAARKFFMGDNLYGWSLIVGLLSKTAGVSPNFSEGSTRSEVSKNQRILGEVTDLISIGYLLHKGVININKNDINCSTKSHNYNKLALLSGDSFLSSSMRNLSHLKNQNVFELMVTATRDLTETEFIGLQDEQDRPIPTKPTNTQTNITIHDHFDAKPYSVKGILGNPRAEWTLRNILGGATLLGKSCQSAVIFAEHSEDIQKLCYVFGKNTALAWQVCVEVEAFLSGSSAVFSLVSAPVMLHLEHDPNLYGKIEKGQKNVLDVDYEHLRKAIQRGPGLKNTQNLQEEFVNNALGILNAFPSSDACLALENIIKAMTIPPDGSHHFKTL